MILSTALFFRHLGWDAEAGIIQDSRGRRSWPQAPEPAISAAP